MSCAGPAPGSPPASPDPRRLDRKRRCPNCGKAGAAYYRHRKTTIRGNVRYNCGRINYFRKMYGVKSKPVEAKEESAVAEEQRTFVQLCITESCLRPASLSDWCVECAMLHAAYFSGCCIKAFCIEKAMANHRYCIKCEMEEFNKRSALLSENV